MSDLVNTHTIQYGTTTIDFSLTYSSRKSLGISVSPELDVRVVAPYDSTLEKIMEKVENKARWIVNQKE